MVISIQNAVIHIILNPLAHNMYRFSKKAKDVLFIACMVVMIMIQFMYSSGILACRYFYIYAAGCVLVGGMILAGLEKENLKCVSFNKVLLLSWLGVGVFALISGILISVDYLTDALLYLVAFPIFFIVWCNEEFSRLARLLITSVKISFVACVLILFARYPIGAFHYAGFFLNPNRAALYFSAAFVCIMQSVFIKDTTIFQKVSNYCLLGLAFALVFYTNSRGGLLSVICCYLFTTILYVYIHRKNLKCTLIKAVILPIVAISLFICITPHIMNAGNRIVEQVAPNTVEQKEPISSVSLNDQLDYLEEKFGKNDRDANSYTAGRLELWRIYGNELRFFGNPSDKILYDASGKVEGRSSHLTVLQIAYQFGIVAGILFLTFNVVAGIKSIKVATYKNASETDLFPFAIAIAFGVFSLVEAISMPFYTLLVLLYFISQTPIIGEISK